MRKFRGWLTRKKRKQTEAAKIPTTGKQPNDDKAWGNPAPTVQLTPKSPLTPKEDGAVIFANDIKSASFQPSKSVTTQILDSAPPIPIQNQQSQSAAQIAGAFGINHAPSPSSPPPPPTEVRIAIPAPSTQVTSSHLPPPAPYQAPDSVPVPCSQRPCVSSPPSPSSQGLNVTPKDLKDISLEVGIAESLGVEQAGSSPFPPPPQPPLEFLEYPSSVLHSQSTSKTQPSSHLSRSKLQKSDSKVVDSTLKLNKYPNDRSHLKSRSLSAPRLLTNFPILNLLPELILSVAGHLDYSTAILLSLSCKKLHNIIPIPKQTPDWPQKRTMLQIYPSIRTFAGDRNPPYLCEDCQIWHTFEHMVIWPNPQPENRFSSYIDFKYGGGRVCTRYAVKTPQLRIKGAFWIPGQTLDSKYFLCKDCNTPSKYFSNNKGKRCQWNCGICGSCRGRKSWSPYCDRCWRPAYSMQMWNDAYEYQPLQLSLVDESKKKTCGLCLGILNYSTGSREMCCCTESRHNSTSPMWYE